MFTKLDLSNAYQQIALAPEAMELLTINTHKGLFQYQRLPYGVKVAPALFQSIMDQILVGLDGVCCYIDDILITSRDMKSHVQMLDRVLSRLEEYGVLIKKEKCAFGIDSVQYLGHVIDKTGIRPSPEKVQAIQAIKNPESIAELRTLLGVVTFYHKFIPNFATVCEPLYQLTKKGVKWNWSEDCTRAVKQLKGLLSSDVVLTHYDVNRPVKLATDASPHGVAAVLSHVDENGNERPVSYASRTLTAAEKNYSQLEREALGIMFGIKRFHKFIYGRKFVLVTDNQPLMAIFSPSKDIPTMSAMRLQRWALVLMAHDYQIEYRKSKDHGNVDALSRFPEETVCETLEQAVNYFSYVDNLPVTSADVKSATAKDPVLCKVLRYVMFGWPNKSEEDIEDYYRRRNELSVEQGCLLWGVRVIIPQSLRQQVLKDLHHEHTGIVRMKMLARSYLWYPKMDQDLESLVSKCEACARHAKAPTPAPIVSWPKCTAPWERVHIDFGAIDGKDLLILIDCYSKWIEVAVMSSTTSAQVITVLRSWWARFGLPVELVSDNGPQFTSEELEGFLLRNGVKHTLTPPYSPQTNGAAEKSVQVVKSILKKQMMDDQQVDKVNRTFQQKLDDFLITYRSTPSTVTGASPAELVMGRKLRTRLSFLRPETNVQVNTREVSNNLRKFDDGAKVWVRNVTGRVKWSPGQIIRREGLLKYHVLVNQRQRLVHVNHLTKRVGNGLIEVEMEKEPEVLANEGGHGPVLNRANHSSSEEVVEVPIPPAPDRAEDRRIEPLPIDDGGGQTVQIENTQVERR